MRSFVQCHIIVTLHHLFLRSKAEHSLIRILMLGSKSLFIKGVESLICKEIEAEVIGRETSLERALEQFEHMQPDVIVVDSSDPGYDPGRVVSQVLKLGLTAKVIGLNLHANSLCIYRGEQRVAREVKDLVEAIRT